MRRLLACTGLLAISAAACDARLPAPDSPGARLYANRCAGCHRLYAPGSMTGPMWGLTVERMQGELARRGVAPLTAEQQTTLLAYLERHSIGQDPPKDPK
jgi:mono/diheme cytochrome c family protein